MSPSPPPPPRIVLFLCTGNFYRSRFAEVLFNALAPAAGLAGWVAESRGLELHACNVGPISPHARNACRARGLVLAEPVRFPRALAESDLRAAARVIALKEAEHRAYLDRYYPGWSDRVEYWHVHDLDVCGPDEALGKVEQNVTALVHQLKKLNDRFGRT